MTNDERVLKGLMALSDPGQSSFIAEVENNYPERDYIDVRDLSGTQYLEVRKRASIEDDKDNKQGIIITPANKTHVIVSRINNSDELYISMFSAIESFIIDGGENGGVVIAPELITQLAKLTARVDGIIEAINTGIPGVQDGGTALQKSISAKLAALTEKENFNNIQNSKFKH